MMPPSRQAIIRHDGQPRCFQELSWSLSSMCPPRFLGQGQSTWACRLFLPTFPQQSCIRGCSFLCPTWREPLFSSLCFFQPFHPWGNQNQSTFPEGVSPFGSGWGHLSIQAGLVHMFPFLRDPMEASFLPWLPSGHSSPFLWLGRMFREKSQQHSHLNGMRCSDLRIFLRCDLPMLPLIQQA